MAAAKPTPDKPSDEHPLGDLHDYLVPQRPEPSRTRKRRRPSRAPWRPRIVSDFPERIPATSAEVDIFEAHFAEFFDELFRPKS